MAQNTIAYCNLTVDSSFNAILKLKKYIKIYEPLNLNVLKYTCTCIWYMKWSVSNFFPYHLRKQINLYPAASLG